jgi:Protein of unknown function (DUF1761)
MGELTDGVNWLAVGVGTVLSFLLGWLWYSPKLFAKKWIEGINVKPNGSTTPPASAMIMQLLGTFLLSWLVGITAVDYALLTMLLIVATIVALVIANGIFVSKSRYAITTEAGFIVAMAVVMIAVQAIF